MSFFHFLAHGCAFIDVTQPRFRSGNPKLFLMGLIEIGVKSLRYIFTFVMSCDEFFRIGKCVG